MQLSSNVLDNVNFLVGSDEIAIHLHDTPAKAPFDENIIEFLNAVSGILMKDARSKVYSDVITFAFWIRKGSVLKMKERFEVNDNNVRMGKGVAFHIAPSNVPVNFAYSLVAGLICGNANVVRVPTKDFQQVEIITDAFNKVLDVCDTMRPYLLCVRYERNKDINDYFSSIADVRVTWGGNQTIAELRKSELPPRSGEITFADRYSLAVIDADEYLEIDNKERIAEDFYNDTFFSDQNACTSPRIIVWTGEKKAEAKTIFWEIEHEMVKKKYTFQPIQGVNKLTKSYLVAVAESGVKIEKHTDNLIVRVSVPTLTDELMSYRDNSGYFYEYDCDNILDLIPVCNEKKCQTIAYIGNKEQMIPLIEAGVKGIDRIVPMGKTMDFDLIWDGYNLPALLSRIIVVK